MRGGQPASSEEALLVQQAKMVLEFNWSGEYTRPGPRLYPHQWSWDSALISAAYARFAPDRAIKELSHLFDAQWKSGLLPQIVFDPRFSEYFPGAGFWHAGESPDAPPHAKTSGIVQPPFHATAVLAVHTHAPDGPGVGDFLERAYTALVAWHDYLYRERDPRGEGLVYIRHPWESGMDNSPMWDAIMQGMFLKPGDVPAYRRADTHIVSAGDRPDSAEYDRFAYLVKLFADRGYDEERIRGDCPFLVQDVLFNSLLCKAERDLAELARVLGHDGAAHEERAGLTAGAIESRLWDETHGFYLNFDLAAGRPIRVFTAPNLAGPIYAGIPEKDRAARLFAHLQSPSFCLRERSDEVPVPSYDRKGFGFSPVQYWRGPVWININWFLMRGLERYGNTDLAQRLRRAILDLCREAGFYEYFDPLTGQGHGSDLFSWTAALFLDIVLDGGPIPRGRG